MIYTCARRTSDGLLSWADASPNAPDEGAVRQNAANALGGALGDWEYQELSQAQYDALAAAMPGRSYLNGGNLTSQTAPAISSDKAQIEDDGTDTAVITFDVQDAAYAGPITWRVTAPDGTVTTETENAAAGVATLEVTSQLAGSIRVEAEAITRGVGLIEIEAI